VVKIAEKWAVLMNIETNLSLRLPLQLPVRVRILDGLPKLLAGGLPITPVNLILKQKQRERGATLTSLDTYVRAARLYLEFCAYRQQSLVGISNEEFIWFKHALLGDPFPNAAGSLISLSGKRERRTADLMLTLLYSLATDIAERYDATFDWLRYKGELGIRQSPSNSPFKTRRTHSIRWIPRKVLGLPDEQFTHLLRAAHERWGDVIADGDIAWAADPEAQRGALFFRNLTLLLILRCAGSRSSEVVRVRLEDVNRTTSLLYLPTKGHRIEEGRHVPVLLYPWVRDAIWNYVTRFRPLVAVEPNSQKLHSLDHSFLFASHSVRNYGASLSDQSVRVIVSTLRTVLDPPWNTKLTPHMLRHSFGYDLQKHAGAAAVVTGMRHASSRSSEPYTAGPEAFAEELLPKGNASIEYLLAQAGLLEIFR
jgi:integrase